MYKATRDLISARDAHTAYRMNVVKVDQTGTGVSGEADLNVIRMLENGTATGFVSGWIVAPFNKELNLTAIQSHYWNYKDGKYFDSTPGVPSDYEYVTDWDLKQYFADHCLELSSPVSLSLYLKDGEFHLVDWVKGDACDFGPVDELTTEVLFDRLSKNYQFYEYLNGGKADK